MGDDAIGALEMTNVKIQGLPRRTMVSVCLAKEALAEVMGWSDVEKRMPIPLRTSSGAEERGRHLHFSSFQWPFDRELLLGPDERFWWAP